MQEALHALAVRGVHWFDVLDILAVALLLYWVIRQVRGTRAVQMVAGAVVLVVANAVSGWLEMTTTHRILQNLLFYIPFAIIVLFQDTIRKALASLGSAFLSRRMASEATALLARETALASFALAGQRHGALVIFERGQGLKDYADTGMKVHAELTATLLSTIFYPGTPLHDGAVIVVDGLVEWAGCLLPLSSSDLPTEFGTRHRAAIGVTEETDAVCVVVSEERGSVSMAVEGRIEPVEDAETLEQKLIALLGGTRVAPQETAPAA